MKRDNCSELLRFLPRDKLTLAICKWVTYSYNRIRSTTCGRSSPVPSRIARYGRRSSRRSIGCSRRSSRRGLGHAIDRGVDIGLARRPAEAQAQRGDRERGVRGRLVRSSCGPRDLLHLGVSLRPQPADQQSEPAVRRLAAARPLVSPGPCVWLLGGPRSCRSRWWRPWHGRSRRTFRE